MQNKRRKSINRIMTVLVVLGFALIAAVFIHAQNLTEYEGSLEENLSFELPEGFVEEEPSQDDEDDKYYFRKTENKKEVINIYYYGLEEAENYPIDETIHIDNDTEVGIWRNDWDHSYENGLYFTVLHGKECYLASYQCQETDKDKYYDSCSKSQENEMMTFIKSFDYHRPDGSDMSMLKRLHSNFGTGGFIVLVLALLFFIGIPVAFGIGSLLGGKEKKDDAADEATDEENETVISSKDLHASMNRERAAKGEDNIPAINTVQGASTSNLARRDHSWSSVPDFFIKLFRKK